MAQEEKNILLLVDSLGEDLTTYFKELEYKLLNLDDVEDYANLDYIVVSSEEKAIEVSSDFNVEKNNIEVFCIGAVNSIKNFLLNNGRLSVQEDILSSAVGKSLLNKFLNKSGSIHLADNFPKVESIGNFKITNHLSFGSSSDRISIDAFDKGFNIVTLRSYLDHVVYYLTYLRQAGLAGIPYEFEYGITDDFFVLNIHANIKNFVAEYMIDSFGQVNTKEPLKFLLNVVNRCCDFLDVTYVEDPGKLVFTAVWNKGESKILEGFSFSNIKTVKQAVKGVETKIAYYDQSTSENLLKLEEKRLPGGIVEMIVDGDSSEKITGSPEETSKLIAFVIKTFEEKHIGESLDDLDFDEFSAIISGYPDEDIVANLVEGDKKKLLEKIQKKNISDAYTEEIARVKETLKDDDDFKKVIGNKFSDEVVERVSSHVDADILNRILGSEEEDDFAQLIKGNEIEDDFKQVISSMDRGPESDLIQRISDNFEEKASMFDFDKITISSSGGAEDKKGVINNLISSTLNDIEESSYLSKSVASFIKKSAPKRISNSLESYAEKMGETLGSLTKEHYSDFKSLELPSILEDLLNDEESIEAFDLELSSKENVFEKMKPEFTSKFKKKLESKLDKSQTVEKKDNKYVVTDENVQEERLQSLIQETIRETLSDEFALEKISQDEVAQKEQEIVETLSASLAIEKEDVKTIVEKAKEKTKGAETQIVVDKIFESRPDKSSEESEGVIKSEKISTVAESALIVKLKEYEQENEKLKSTVKALQVKVASVSVSNEKLKEVQEQGKLSEAEERKLVSDVETLPVSVGDEEKKKIKENLKEGRALSSEDAEKLVKALEREKEILKQVQNMEIQKRKVVLEGEKREALFKREIEKVAKVAKAKDSVLEKMKDTMKQTASKQLEEIDRLSGAIKSLNKKTGNDTSIKLIKKVRGLEQDNVSLSKIADVYKGKLETMAKSVSKSRKSDNSKQLSEENRELKRFNAQLENAGNIANKTIKSLEVRCSKMRDTEGQMRSQYSKIEKELKATVADLNSLKEKNEKLEQTLGPVSEKSSAAEKVKGLERDLEKVRGQSRELQSLLEESVRKQAQEKSDSKVSPAPSANTQRLEQSVKKMNAELGKAKIEAAEKKKELIKLKSEVNSLKNQNAQLAREVEKSQAKKKKKAA